MTVLNMQYIPVSGTGNALLTNLLMKPVPLKQFDPNKQGERVTCNIVCFKENISLFLFSLDVEVEGTWHSHVRE